LKDDYTKVRGKSREQYMYKPKASRRYQRVQVAEDYYSHFKSGEKDKNAIEV